MRNRLSGIARIIEDLGVLEDDLLSTLEIAVTTDGEHHKQWYLEELAQLLGVRLPDHEPGMAP